MIAWILCVIKPAVCPIVSVLTSSQGLAEKWVVHLKEQVNYVMALSAQGRVKTGAESKPSQVAGVMKAATPAAIAAMTTTSCAIKSRMINMR
jgi:hypothetical protein